MFIWPKIPGGAPFITRMSIRECTKEVLLRTTYTYATQIWPGIRGTQVKSSGNKNRMSPSRSSDGAYFSETPPSWHVRPIFSLIAIVNY